MPKFSKVWAASSICKPCETRTSGTRFQFCLMVRFRYLLLRQKCIVERKIPDLEILFATISPSYRSFLGFQIQRPVTDMRDSTESFINNTNQLSVVIHLPEIEQLDRFVWDSSHSEPMMTRQVNYGRMRYLAVPAPTHLLAYDMRNVSEDISPGVRSGEWRSDR